MASKLFILASLALTAISTTAANKEILDPNQDKCHSTLSCASCIKKSFCTWCVTKSKCTKNDCGNDNVIYPKGFTTIMSGEHFCPRIVERKGTIVLRSGKKSPIAVKLTQIHLYMAFTPWKCRITFNGIELTVVAMLLGDTVYCESVMLSIKTNEPYITGSVKVLWDYSKAFDGFYPFKVCRCDLDPSCEACTEDN